MPDTTGTTAPVSLTVADIKNEALEQRKVEVRKKLVSKYKVIAQRQAVLDAHVADFATKVKAFEDAVASAGSPEDIMAALENHKFPYNCIDLNAVKD